MFQIGLFYQAFKDFEVLRNAKYKDPQIIFNMALSLFQLGQYSKVLPMLEDFIEEDIADKQIIFDSHMLMSQCLWRTDKPLDAIKTFNKSIKYKVDDKSLTNIKNSSLY